MPELAFDVLEARPRAGGVSAAVELDLRVTTTGEVLGGVLSVRIDVDTARRTLRDGDSAVFDEVVGPAAHRPQIAWTTVPVALPAFVGTTLIKIAVPCPLDLDQAATKLLHGLHGGRLPLLFLFSGTVLWAAPEGVRISLVPQSTECRFLLPVQTALDAIDAHWPGQVLIPVDRVTAARLWGHRGGHPTWGLAVSALLDEVEP